MRGKVSDVFYRQLIAQTTQDNPYSKQKTFSQYNLSEARNNLINENDSNLIKASIDLD